jgi:hypothetical protein
MEHAMFELKNSSQNKECELVLAGGDTVVLVMAFHVISDTTVCS